MHTSTGGREGECRGEITTAAKSSQHHPVCSVITRSGAFHLRSIWRPQISHVRASTRTVAPSAAVYVLETTVCDINFARGIFGSAYKKQSEILVHVVGASRETYKYSQRHKRGGEKQLDESNDSNMYYSIMLQHSGSPIPSGRTRPDEYTRPLQTPGCPLP